LTGSTGGAEAKVVVDVAFGIGGGAKFDRLNGAAEAIFVR